MKRVKRLFFWLCWPGLYVYFRSGHRSRVLITAEGKTLLVKGLWGRLFGDEAWGLPGGGIRRGESAASGAVRELFEELQLRIDPSQLVPLGSARVAERGIAYKADFFVLSLTAMPDIAYLSQELQAAEWFSDPEIQKTQVKPEVAQALLFRAHR